MTLSETEIVQRLHHLGEFQFEQLVARVWERRGWEVEVTDKTNDRGVDVVATRVDPFRQKQLIQAKRYRPENRVSSPEIQQYSALKHQDTNVDQVLVVTSSGFTDNALSLAHDLNIKCIDGATLCQLIIEHGGSEFLRRHTDSGDSTTHDLDQVDTGEPNVSENIAAQPRTSVADSGDGLSVELTGLTRVETVLPGSGILSSDIHLDGVMATFKLFGRNQGDANPILEMTEEVKFFDESGDEYNPAKVGNSKLPEGWHAFGGRDSCVDIPNGGRINFLTGVSMPSSAKVSRITIPRYNIELSLDADLRVELDSLPAEVEEIV